MDESLPPTVHGVVDMVLAWEGDNSIELDRLLIHARSCRVMIRVQ